VKRIIFHNQAELELWQAVDYYEKKYAGLGLDLQQEVSRALVDIHAAPEKWPIKKHGARRRLLQRFPYAIYYLPLPEVIWIVAVAHTSRKPDYWRDRIK